MKNVQFIRIKMSLKMEKYRTYEQMRFFLYYYYYQLGLFVYV